MKRKTVSKRLRAKLLEAKQQLRKRMHEPAAQNGRWLRSIVQGYFNYHAAPGNIDGLSAFRHRLIRLWRTTIIHRVSSGTSRGRGCKIWPIDGFRGHVFSIRTPEFALTLRVQDKSLMR